MSEKSILTIQETVERSMQKGMPITQYTLRRALHSGAIPCRVVGRKYLIAWENVEKWLKCVDGAGDITLPASHTIRRLSI